MNQHTQSEGERIAALAERVSGQQHQLNAIREEIRAGFEAMQRVYGELADRERERNDNLRDLMNWRITHEKWAGEESRRHDSEIRSLRDDVNRLLRIAADAEIVEVTARGVWRSQYTWALGGIGFATAVIGLVLGVIELAHVL